jgi:hypothetical protein
VIKRVKEKEQWFFRKKSDEWKLMFYENKVVYAALLVLLTDLDGITDEIKVKIDCYEDFETFSYNEFTGIIPINGLAIDEDSGVIRFTPEPKDAYAWYDEYKDQKVNILIDIPFKPITYTGHPVLYRLYFDTSVEDPDVSEYVRPAGPPDTYVIGQSYSPGAQELGWGNKGWCLGSDGGYYKCISAHTGAAAKAPVTGANWATYWQIVTLHASWGQTQTDVPVTGYTQGNDIYDTDFPNVTTQVTGATNCDSSHWFVDGNDVTPIAGNKLTDFARNIIKTGDYPTANGVLNLLLYRANQTFTVVSQYFSAATNPVTGVASRTLNVCLAPILTVKNYYVTVDHSGDALVYEMTLAEYFKFLAVQYNVFWYIDGTNLVVEHRKFFENDYSYTVPMPVGVDLTDHTTYLIKKYAVLNSRDIDQQINSNSYSYPGGDYVQWEEFNYRDGGGSPGIIEYTSKIVKPGKKTDYDVRNFMCDFYVLVLSPDTVQDDGLFVIAADVSDVMYTRDAIRRGYSRGAVVPATYLNVQNGDLFWDNVIRDWHTYGRQLASGKVTGTTVVFDSVVPMRKQVELSFPRLAEFDPMKLVTTGLGDGFTEAAELNTETDFIKITLLYP